MSRIPPKIEQVIDGVPVKGWVVQPITYRNISYALSSEHRLSVDGEIVGQDHYVEAMREDGTALWKTKYASFDFDMGLETDVQEKFPVDFFVHENGAELIIKLEHYTENDRIFRIMLEDGSEKLKSDA